MIVATTPADVSSRTVAQNHGGGCTAVVAPVAIATARLFAKQNFTVRQWPWHGHHIVSRATSETLPLLA
jgi:hypothetical protein